MTISISLYFHSITGDAALRFSGSRLNDIVDIRRQMLHHRRREELKYAMECQWLRCRLGVPRFRAEENGMASLAHRDLQRCSSLARRSLLASHRRLFPSA